MPDLPKKKVGLVACCGEEMAEGTVTRLAVRKVLDELRPGDTVTICLPLFLAGGEGDPAFAQFFPTITVDGCSKRCAYRGTERYSNKPAASVVVDALCQAEGLPAPVNARRLTPASQAAVDAVAEDIAFAVDELLGTQPAAADEGAVSTGACSCGSGKVVTRVEVDGATIELSELDGLFELLRGRGQKVDEPLSTHVLDMVGIYNAIPADKKGQYFQAVTLAWQAYCRKLGGGDG